MLTASLAKGLRRAHLVAGRCLPYQIVARQKFDAEIGWTNELHAWIGAKGRPNFGCHPNGGFAHGQRPIFGLTTQRSHPNTLVHQPCAINCVHQKPHCTKYGCAIQALNILAWDCCGRDCGIGHGCVTHRVITRNHHMSAPHVIYQQVQSVPIIRVCLVCEKFMFWYYSIFHCYLVINV